MVKGPHGATAAGDARRGPLAPRLGPTRRSGPIRAVVFDLDDTLCRERDYVRSGYRAVAEALRRRTGRPAAYEDWMWKRFLTGRRSGTFDALSRRFRLALTDADVAALVAVYRNHRPHLRPCRGVRELLVELRRRRRKVALLSDGFLPAQRLKLDALALERLFDAVVFTESLGRDAWKPSPRGFQAVRRKLAVPHHACAYVADNPAKDFLAPNALGWLTVQWRRPGQLHADGPAPPGGAPARTVRSAPALLKLLLNPPA